MKTREELQAERRQLEDAYRNAYEALDTHFLLYGDVDGPEPIGFYQPNDDGPYALPFDEGDDDDTPDFTEEDLVT